MLSNLDHTPVDLRRGISLKLTIVARQMRAHFDNAVSELGITRSQWTLIAVVSATPGATQREISRRLEISEVSAGRLIERLLTDGLVERRLKEEDRRAHAVYLTEAGMAIANKLGEIGRHSETAVFASFSDEELATLDELLDRMSTNLSGETPPAR